MLPHIWFATAFDNKENNDVYMIYTNKFENQLIIEKLQNWNFNFKRFIN